MAYFAYILAFFTMFFKESRSFNEWVDIFLGTAAIINGLFFSLLLIIGLLLLFAALLMSAGREQEGAVISGTMSCGALVLVVGQGINFFLSSIMSNAWSAEMGMTDPNKFIVALIITVLIGIT